MPDLETTITVVDACGRADVPPLLVSDPGVGKSSVVRALADAQGVPCETVLGSIRDRADIGGLPLAREEDYILVPGLWARRLREHGCGYVFLDELTTCPPEVQGAMLAVVLDKTVGDVQLPPNVRVVAGANPPGSAAGGYPLEPPMANRLCHVLFEPTTEEWLTGMTTGWKAPPPSRAVAATEVAIAAARAEVIGYIAKNPAALDGFSQAAQKSGPWASRRTWDMLSRTLAFVRDDDTAAIHALALGLVGEGVGTEFLEWRTKADLPDPEQVINEPSSFGWAKAREDVLYTVLASVVSWASQRATQDAWRAAWGPMVAAAHAGRIEVAAAGVRSLATFRPPSVGIPRAARVFEPVLRDAGLWAKAAAA